MSSGCAMLLDPDLCRLPKKVITKASGVWFVAIVGL